MTWMSGALLAGLLAGAQDADPRPAPKPGSQEAPRRVLRKLNENQARRFHSAYGTAVDLVRQQQWKRATEPLEEALSLDPNHPQSARLLALCHFRLKDWEAAPRSLLQAMNLAPEDPELRHMVIAAFTEMGRNEEALQILEDTKRRLGRSVELLEQETHLRSKMGQAEKTLALLREWKRSDPKNVNVRHQLMQLLEDRGDVDQALEEALEFVVDFPADPSGRVRISFLLIKAERYEEAGQVLENLVRDRPKELALRRRLIDLYEGPLNNTAKARHHRQLLEQWDGQAQGRSP